MDKEELLKPRFKVINHWPNMKDFHRAQIIECSQVWNPGYFMYVIEDCQGKREYLEDFFLQYPHLFEHLDWWHERSDDQLPQYLKFIANKKKVVKLVKLYNRDMVDIDDNGKTTDCLDMELFLPATEEEYIAYSQKP